MKNEEIKTIGERAKINAIVKKFTTFIKGGVEMRTDEENNLSKRLESLD